MTWFETLTGFREQSPGQVRAHIVAEGHTLTSRVNGKTMVCGQLETPTLADLRARARAAPPADGPTTLREVVGDVQRLHTDAAHAGALFQVASQFNLLEMVAPSVTPEAGVGRYENDRTQGPACAIAAGAGTIYRNYFADVNGQVGQSADNQIDCLADLGRTLGNTDGRLWTMRNGYALASRDGLAEIAERLASMPEAGRDALRRRLRVGIQWETQVTLDGCEHTVTQVYASALPVAYTALPAELWAPFARLVLEAAYEATLCAAVLNRARTGSRQVFLTLLGGGAFGNSEDWIFAAVERALGLFAETDLDLAIVSYGRSHAPVRALASRYA